ncbi:MAG: hypothetical protein D3906_01090 [Candidatus Electrothrix sp. AUS1_2]|nr:hypothetical protein [Candidatus Electrothrix sp. AUS1_2]
MFCFFAKEIPKNFSNACVLQRKRLQGFAVTISLNSRLSVLNHPGVKKNAEPETSGPAFFAINQ